MHALREAGKALGRPHLTGCVVYTSAEPCPMCYTACMWARIEKIYYAATYADVKEYGKFEDEDFLAELKAPNEARKVQLEQVGRDEAVEVWKKFAVMADKVHY
jgi:guanine deaminase